MSGDRGPRRPSRAARVGTTVAVLAALALLGAVTAAPPARAAATRLVKVTASADATVRADRPRSRAGKDDTLRVDGAPRSRAYLRFRLRRLSGRVVRQASLWVHLSRRERWRGVQAAATNGRAWSERRLSWVKRPTAARAVGSTMRAPRRWRKIDITGLVRANGKVDVVLTSARSTGVLFDSREAGRALAPRLHLRTARDAQPGFPLRTAVYDPLYPAQWKTDPPVYHPRLGRYDGASPFTLAAHTNDLTYGGFDAGLTAWDGPDTATDERLSALLDLADRTRSKLRWAAAPTAEATGTPSRPQIAAQLLALDTAHGRDPGYLRVRGRPVVFVTLASGDGCGALRRWVKGNARQRAYLVFQTWPGYEACTGATPSDFFSLVPDGAPTAVGRSSYSISPGFFTAAETTARKARDLPRFYSDVRGQAASRARFQLVDSYNDWGAGTAVEAATEWASPSGHGQYLDALHAGGLAPADTTAVAAAAGDIACDDAAQQASAGSTSLCQQGATAALAESLQPTFVLALGDLQYGAATLNDFTQQYDASWGRLKAITYPAVGNHEYADAGAAGYFSYFGPRAGTPRQGWYSYDAGGWHIVVLNSECATVGCGNGSAQETWLAQDLAAHPTPCTLAYWHRPRFTGGHEGEAPSMGPIWRDLYQAGVELVLNGHQHQYERFEPQSPDRVLDRSGGVVEIVSGTGGRSHIQPVTTRANTAVQNADTFGVTRLELHPLSWSARFVPAPGLGSFTDSTGGDCH